MQPSMLSPLDCECQIIDTSNISTDAFDTSIDTSIGTSIDTSIDTLNTYSADVSLINLSH